MALPLKYLKINNELLKRIKQFPGLKLLNFGIEEVLDTNSRSTRIKIYYKENADCFFSYDITPGGISIVSSNLSGHRQRGIIKDKDREAALFLVFNTWLRNIQETINEEQLYKSLKAEMNPELTEFLNSAFWENDEPLSNLEKVVLLEKTKLLLNRINSMPINPGFKSYSKSLLKTIIQKIKENVNRKTIKNLFLEFLQTATFTYFLDDNFRSQLNNHIIDIFHGIGQVITFTPLLPG